MYIAKKTFIIFYLVIFQNHILLFQNLILKFECEISMKNNKYLF